MNNSKRNSIASVFLILSIAAQRAGAAPAVATSEECGKEWASQGQMKSKKYIFGLGVSSKTDRSQAIDEAKSQAFRDVGLQLRSSVSSQSTLSETQDGASYNGSIGLESKASDLTGIVLIKDGSNPKAGITHCAVAKFDVSAAYAESEGKMTVLEKQLKDIFAAAKKKNYVEVLQKRGRAHELVKTAGGDISRADMFRGFLNEEPQSWFEKINGSLADVDKMAEEAKSQVAFNLPGSGEFEGTLSDIESRLTGSGFEVLRNQKSAKPVVIRLEVQQVGTPRKTKTVLGETLIARVMVALKDQSGKIIATNNGASVTGTGATDEDALANIDRQLLAHVLEVFHSGLPGLVNDQE